MLKKGDTFMKNKLKMILCCLFIIPCILVMSGCSNGISSVEFAKLLKQTSDSYYSVVTKTDFTLTNKQVIEEKRLEPVNHSYDGLEYLTDWCELKVTTTQIETIVVDYDGNELHNIQITTYEKEVETGSKMQQDGTGVEPYTIKNESTTVKTLITTKFLKHFVAKKALK